MIAQRMPATRRGHVAVRIEHTQSDDREVGEPRDPPPDHVHVGGHDPDVQRSRERLGLPGRRPELVRPALFVANQLEQDGLDAGRHRR
jgi:hypothetical protein